MAALTAVTTFSIIPDVVLMTVSLSCYVSVSHKSVTDTDFAQKPVFPFFCDHAGRSLRSAANANFTTYSKVHRSNLGNQCTSPDRPTSGIALKAKRSPPSLTAAVFRSFLRIRAPMFGAFDCRGGAAGEPARADGRGRARASAKLRSVAPPSNFLSPPIPVSEPCGAKARRVVGSARHNW